MRRACGSVTATDSMRKYDADENRARPRRRRLRGAFPFGVVLDGLGDDLADLVLREARPLRGFHDQQQVLLFCFLRSPRHRLSLVVAVFLTPRYAPWPLHRSKGFVTIGS